MNIPPNLKYAETHEWVKLQGDIATIGITDHAQKELTDIVFVELPKVGQKLSAGKPSAVVESVKAASDIYSPISGQVLEVNEQLSSNPALVNTDPYEKGWFFKIKLFDTEEMNNLKDAKSYQEQIGG